MQKTFLHTGSNLGNRIENLKIAESFINEFVGTIKLTSQYYETAAWGNIDQPSFINQALLVETNLSPQDLLKVVLKIEQNMGRIRLYKWGERLIDIDILFYENEIIDTRNLKIPHPFLHKRNFVLVPMLEIAKNWNHPVFDKTIKELLANCEDDLEVNVFSI